MSSFRATMAVTSEHALALFKRLDLRSNEQNQSQTFRAAKTGSNTGLNRWYNVLPFDSTRVKLECATFDTDYINASFVNVNEANRCYILTQGPLKETTWHFWYMVYQTRSTAIIMLCKLTENGFCKCSRYWPDSMNSEDIARDENTGLEVSLLSEEESNDTVIRKIELRHNPSQTVRRITQYHYNRWPDFGVPSEPQTFLKLLKKVSREHPSYPEHPNIVHCSAGIGRSGTFCLVDSCIQIMNKRKTILTQEEVMDILLKMRSCRQGLVQTPEQLKFSFQAIGEAISTMDLSLDNSFIDNLTNSEKDSHSVINGNKAKHTRKRSTTEDGNDNPSTECTDETCVVTDEDVTKVNGESQAKRPKGNKDW